MRFSTTARKGGLRKADVHVRDKHYVVSLATTVWDQRDLNLIRRAVEAVARRGTTKVALDMSRVDRLPQGFLQQLCVWAERGLRVLLLDPPPAVQAMTWFRLFAVSYGSDAYLVADHGGTTAVEAWSEADRGPSAEEGG